MKTIAPPFEYRRIPVSMPRNKIRVMPLWEEKRIVGWVVTELTRITGDGDEISTTYTFYGRGTVHDTQHEAMTEARSWR